MGPVGPTASIAVAGVTAHVGIARDGLSAVGPHERVGALHLCAIDGPAVAQVTGRTTLLAVIVQNDRTPRRPRIGRPATRRHRRGSGGREHRSQKRHRPDNTHDYPAHHPPLSRPTHTALHPLQNRAPGLYARHAAAAPMSTARVVHQREPFSRFATAMCHSSGWAVRGGARRTSLGALSARVFRSWGRCLRGRVGVLRRGGGGFRRGNSVGPSVIRWRGLRARPRRLCGR